MDIDQVIIAVVVFVSGYASVKLGSFVVGRLVGRSKCLAELEMLEQGIVIAAGDHPRSNT